MITANFQKKVFLMARDLDSEWASLQYADHLFPKLAAKYLNRFDSSNLPSLSEIHQELTSLTLPEQTFSSTDFSDFPLTLARTDLFSIDLYYWYTLDTGIHDHHFHGAFKIVEGGSLDIHYDFKLKKKFDYVLSHIELNKIGICHHKLGDVQEINRYEKFIHQVFHLEFPTITLCIRTNKVFGDDPLSVYLYPNYRISFHEMSVNQRKWLLALNNLLERNNTISEVPFNLGETFLILYRHLNRRYILTPLVYDFFKSHLKILGFNEDVQDLCDRSNKASLKLRQLFVITEMEKIKSGSHE